MLQEPLYLPSNAELHVHMWRLTNTRQVWYEWYVEAFLPMPGVASAEARPKDDDGQFLPVDPGQGALFGSPSLPHSPLADALDAGEGTAKAVPVIETQGGEISLIKINQTSLHNPGGRSSWIGL